MLSTEQIRSLLESSLTSLQAIDDERDRTIRERDHVKTFLSTKEKELAEMSSKHERAVGDLKASLLDLARLQSQLKDADARALLDNEKIRGLIEHNTAAESSLTVTKQELASTAADLARERLAFQEANASVIDLNRRCAILRTDLTAEESTVAHLAAQHKRAEAECAQLKLKASADAAESLEVKGQHASRVALLSQRCASLTDALAAAWEERETEANCYNELVLAKDAVDLSLAGAREENKALAQRLIAAEDRLLEVHARYAEAMRLYSGEKDKVATNEEVIRKLTSEKEKRMTPLRRSNRLSETSSETENLVTPPRRRVSVVPPLTAGVTRAHRSLTKKTRRIS